LLSSYERIPKNVGESHLVTRVLHASLTNQKASSWISEEHCSLLAAIDVQSWLTDISRRVQHYGYHYDYEARKVDPGTYVAPFPIDHCQLLITCRRKASCNGQTN
jgi:hypothetical protein